MRIRDHFEEAIVFHEFASKAKLSVCYVLYYNKKKGEINEVGSQIIERKSKTCVVLLKRVETFRYNYGQ